MKENSFNFNIIIFSTGPHYHNRIENDLLKRTIRNYHDIIHDNITYDEALFNYLAPKLHSDIEYIREIFRSQREDAPPPIFIYKTENTGDKSFL